MKYLPYMVGLVCLFTSVTFAVSVNFTNNAGDNLWRTAGNWNPGSVPGTGSGDYALVCKPSVDCIIDAGTAAVAGGGAYIGHSNWGGNGQLVMTGGTFNPSGIYIGCNATGIFTLSGGNVTVATNVMVGHEAYGVPGNGTLTVTGGTLTTDGMNIPRAEVAGTGKVNLYGGTIWVTDSFLMNYTNGSAGAMDLKGTGVFKWSGDKVGQLNSYVANGWIYTSDPRGAVDIFYDSGADLTTVRVVSAPVPTCIDLQTAGLGNKADLNYDCSVDFKDLMVLTSEWLDSSLNQ